MKILWEYLASVICIFLGFGFGFWMRGWRDTLRVLHWRDGPYWLNCEYDRGYDDGYKTGHAKGLDYRKMLKEM